MKRFKFLLLIFTIMMMNMGVCGCMNFLDNQLGYSDVEYISAIEEALKSKYDLSFKVESLGGAYGTGDNTTIKAWCYCREGEYANLKFMAEVDKADLNIVKDEYLNIVAANMVSKEILKKSGMKAKVYSVIETSVYSSASEIANLKDYLAQIGYYFVTTHLFIETESEYDLNKYAEIVYEIGKSAESVGSRELSIIVWFVEQLTDDIDTTFYETDIGKRYNAFVKKEYVKCYSTVQLKGGELSTDMDSIIATLEKE